MADGKITIDAEISAKRAEAQLLALEVKMTRLADRIKNLKAQRNILPTEEFSRVQKRIKEAEAGIDEFANKMDKLRRKGKTDTPEFADAEKQQDNYFAALERAEEARDRMLAAGTAMAGPGDAGYDALTLQIRQAEAEQEALGAKWRAISAGMGTDTQQTISATRGSLNAAIDLAAEGLSRIARASVKGFETMGTWAAKAAGTIKGTLAKALASAVTGLRNIFTHGKSAGSAISEFGRRVASLVKAAVVFNVIRRALSEVTSGIGDAVKSFASYNSELNSNISVLQTALSGLQGSIASAFAPIINAAVPAIVTLIGYLTTAINVLGQFMAALTGRTSYTRLVANQKNYAGALNNTANAAKSASNNLAKFDDLDVLSKDSSAGGGGSGADYAGTEEIPIDGALKDLADLLKNGKFFDFGNQLADMLADMLEQIPWEEIRTKAYEMGQHLAEILNGVFSNLRLAVDLGITLAQAINTALDFLYGFITTFNWTQFGVWWGYFFNAFVQTMDWNLLGDTILAGINGVIASIRAFFTTIYVTMQQLGENLGSNFQKVMAGIDWTGAANTVLMGLTDITSLMNGWNRQINWTEIADSMMNGVNEVARGMVMDPNGTIHQVWSENGTAVGTAIQNFLSGVHEFISAFPFEQVTTSLSRWFQNAMAAINWNQIGDTINQMVTGLIDSIVQFISDSKNREAIAGAIAGMFEGLDLAEITQSIFDLIGSLFELFTETIQEMDWMTIGILILEAIIVGLLATDPLILAVAAITALLFELLMKLASDIADNVSAWMQGILDTISQVGNRISNAWNTLWTNVANIGRTIWNGIKTTITTIMTAIQTTITAILNAVKAVWNTIWTAIHSIASNIWNTIRTTITNAFTTTSATISTILNAIRTTWSTIWTAISTVAATIWGTIRTTIGTAFSAIRTTIGTVLDSIADKWKTAWDGMKSTLKGIINGIIGIVQKMVDAVVGGINGVIDALNSIHVDIPSWVPKYGGSSFGLDLGHVSAPHIPTLANGGITTGATLAEIGEAGREAVLPLEQNTGWMDDLAMKIADVMDSRAVSGINSVTMELNGQELARIALDDLVSEIQRRGMTVDTVFA